MGSDVYDLCLDYFYVSQELYKTLSKKLIVFAKIFYKIKNLKKELIKGLFNRLIIIKEKHLILIRLLKIILIIILYILKINNNFYFLPNIL